jgi:biopolymer transport protein ExbD
MKFKRRLRIEEGGLSQFDIAPFINITFLIIIFFMLTFNLMTIPGMNVNLPNVLSSQDLNPQVLMIAISDKDVIYIQDKSMIIKDLETFIKKEKYNSVFIKSDKNVKIGVVAQIWGICKKLGIERIGIATASN